MLAKVGRLTAPWNDAGGGLPDWRAGVLHPDDRAIRVEDKACRLSVGRVPDDAGRSRPVGRAIVTG
ncbi:hypothetical protein ACFTSF_41530 [Kribbella sp. NPDC056951]|uniref:hypothetical protein n=1 Tax=Kribbella sp. NPDC056951 TaxID=3345978 RepID=UPI003645A084